FKKFKIGTTVYADYGLYTHTGFGPQFSENLNPPGPGNNIYNSFDITRTYLNFYFTPNDDWTMRVTPDIYRTLGAATGDREGKTTAFGSNLSGNLGFRLKYAYLDYNKPFSGNESLKEDKVTFGMLPNPLIAW